MLGWRYQWGAARKGCVDCSGAFVYAMKRHGLSIYHGSNTIWRKYLSVQGRVGEIPLAPGMAVFKWKRDGAPAKFAKDKLGNFFHMGLYIGNGQVIEAKSTKHGVIRSSIEGWTHCGMIRGIAYEGGVTGQMPEPLLARVTTAGGSLNLRAGASKSSAIRKRIPRHDTVVVMDNSNPAWWFVSHGGVKGFVMAAYLTVNGVSARD